MFAFQYLTEQKDMAIIICSFNVHDSTIWPPVIYMKISDGSFLFSDVNYVKRLEVIDSRIRMKRIRLRYRCAVMFIYFDLLISHYLCSSV